MASAAPLAPGRPGARGDRRAGPARLAARPYATSDRVQPAHAGDRTHVSRPCGMRLSEAMEAHAAEPARRPQSMPQAVGFRPGDPAQAGARPEVTGELTRAAERLPSTAGRHPWHECQGMPFRSGAAPSMKGGPVHAMSGGSRPGKSACPGGSRFAIDALPATRAAQADSGQPVALSRRTAPPTMPRSCHGMPVDVLHR